MNGPFRDQSGAGSVVAAELAAEHFAAHRRRAAGQDRVGRSSEQARRRRPDRPRVDRPRRRGGDRRFRQLRRRPGDQYGDGGETSHVCRNECRHFRPDRQILQAHHRAVDDGHLRPGQRRRSGDDAAGRRHLVLHFVRLRAWRGVGAGCNRRTHRPRRQSPRIRQTSARYHGFFIVPAAGAGLRRQGRCAWPIPAPT